MERVSDNEVLQALDAEQVRTLHSAVMQDIQDLRGQWARLGLLADRNHDEDILKIFARLNQLEYDCLPMIERRLRQTRRTVGCTA